MEIGVREFRSRLGELLNRDEPVTITSHGRVLGEFTPAVTGPERSVDPDAWLARRAAARLRWQAANPDWEVMLTRQGLDSEGSRFDDPPFR